MNNLVVSLLALSLALVAGTAAADESTPGPIVLQTTTVYGRADKPHVEIILTRSTAAAAAGAAHDGLHTRLMASAPPRPMSH